MSKKSELLGVFLLRILNPIKFKLAGQLILYIVI